MKIWPVVIETVDQKQPWESRELVSDVRAPGGPEAVITALTGLKLRDGELLHMIHIGVPK